MRSISRFILTFISVLTVLACGRAADHPREDLLRLVPPETAICILVQDIRDHSHALAQSPFLDHFQKSPVGRAILGNADWQQLREVQKKLEGALPWTIDQLRDEV